MAFFDMFTRSGWLSGSITVMHLPPHLFYSVSIELFRVRDESSPLPSGGHPSVEECFDSTPIKSFTEPDDKPLRFRERRPAGFYHLRVSLIVVMDRSGRKYAQVERFFPLPRPCHCQARVEAPGDVSITWSDVPLESLNYYCTFRPGEEPTIDT